jgi:hypothetical protein
MPPSLTLPDNPPTFACFARPVQPPPPARVPEPEPEPEPSATGHLGAGSDPGAPEG